MKKFARVLNPDRRLIGYRFNCPICEIPHEVYTASDRSVEWGFNGDVESPTIEAQIQVRYKAFYASRLGVEIKCFSHISIVNQTTPGEVQNFNPVLH